MKKFEEKLSKVEIPEISDMFLEYELKEKLEKKYFYHRFKLPFRVALGSALVMFIFTLSIVIKPDIATNINYAFTKESNNQIVENSQQDEASESVSTDQWQGFEGLATLDNHNPMLNFDEMRSVSDTTNETIKYLNPDDFEEGKVYLIRRYKSQDKQGVIMINEVESRDSGKGVIRKISR